MSLAARLNRPRVAGCVVAQILAQLDDEDRSVLVEALADRVGYTAVAILDALRAEGYELGLSAVKMHRTGRCCCGSL